MSGKQLKLTIDRAKAARAAVIEWHGLAGRCSEGALRSANAAMLSVMRGQTAAKAVLEAVR